MSTYLTLIIDFTGLKWSMADQLHRYIQCSIRQTVCDKLNLGFNFPDFPRKWKTTIDEHSLIYDEEE